MDNYYTNRHTILTLRWIYGNNREEEFLSCTSKEKLKAFVWKYMKPLFETEDRMISGYRGINEIIYKVKPKEESLSDFKKGMSFVHFDALYEYLLELKRPAIIKLVSALKIKIPQSENKPYDFEKDMDDINRSIVEEQKTVDNDWTQL